MGCSAKEVGSQFRLIDTQGFGDPNHRQAQLWYETVTALSNISDINFADDGLCAIIIPIMVSESLRIDDQTMAIIFESLLSFSLIHEKMLDNPSSEHPQLLIILNGFDS